MPLASYAEVLDAVRGVAWPALRRVRTTPVGAHASVVRGTTAEFLEYRPYRQGDDPGRIDWKLVARTDRVFVRVSQERTILPTILVVDGSASMAFPEDTFAKWQHARRIAIGLAAIARHRGDPVGLAVALDDDTIRVEARTRSTVIEEMMRALDRAPGGSAPIARVAVEALRLGARVVLISDFLEDDVGGTGGSAVLEQARIAAAAGREIYAVHVVDRSELDPDARQRLVTDPEHPQVRRPMLSSVRAEYVRRFADWRSRLARDWRRAGAVYTMTVPGEEPLRRTIRRITAAGDPGGDV